MADTTLTKEEKKFNQLVNQVAESIGFYYQIDDDDTTVEDAVDTAIEVWMRNSSGGDVPDDIDDIIEAARLKVMAEKTNEVTAEAVA